MTAARTVGRYEILRELGRGGTATVYLARQTELRRLVALKELSALPVSDPSTARRFVRESRLAGGLNHPNIVTVHDFFEDHSTPYIAMEYLERGSLRPLMRRMTFAQIAGVLEGVLAGLAHAHEHDIVHRDLKPENLMVTADGRVKIADFGIAKVTDEAQAGTVLTVKGTTIGTPTYMAPEQALADDIGPWTDLYAVGIIAFELLAGRPPFDTTGSPMSMLLRQVNDPPLELKALDPSVDPRLSDWVARLLEKEPEDRPQSAGPAWMALEGLVLDRLGPRWRHNARLLGPGATQSTPTTLPMAQDERRDEVRDERLIATEPPSAVPTARPRSAAAGRGGRQAGRGGLAAAAAAGAGAVAARARGGALPPVSSARRLVTPILLVLALVLAAIAFAVTNGNRGGGAATPTSAPPARQSAPPARQGAPAGGNQAAPAGRGGAATPDRSGVGDSQSDDPSDDEPDVGEP